MTDTRDRRTLIATGLLLGLFLAALEVSVVSTAMPRVIDELGGRHLYSLPFALYLLFATVSGPLWGYTSDQYGRRKLYLASVGLFLAGSALCGAAQSMSWLVAARALQGLGAGGLQTITFTIIGELYPLEKRAQIQGFISAVWGFSALIGPLVGGFIVDHFSWRWVFYINVPFGIAGSLLVMSAYIDTPRRQDVRVDTYGALVFTLGAGLLVYGLQVQKPVLALAGTGILSFFPFLELRQPVPLVPFRTLRDPLLGRSVMVNVLGGMAFFGMVAYLPLFVQQARHQSATIAGALLSPSVLGWTIASIVAARLLPRVGPRPLAMWGAAGMILGFGLWTQGMSAPLWALGAAGMISGLGMGSAMLALFVSAQEMAPREVLGSVTAALLFGRNIGGSLGSAAMGALLGGALDTGGESLGAAFWRVPAFSTGLSALVLLIVLSLPTPERAASPSGSSPPTTSGAL